MTVTIDPPKFIIYCVYHDAGDDGGLAWIHADNPFEAHIQHCQRITKMERWEACAYLEEGAWTGTIHRVTGPYTSEQVPWTDRGYPWDAIRDLRRECTQLEKVLPTAVQLQELSEAVPDFQIGGLPVQALMQRIETKKGLLAELQARWDLEKTKPPEQASGREKRGIEIVDPAVTELMRDNSV